MTNDKLRIRAVNAPWYAGIEILISEHPNQHRPYAVATEMVFRQVTPGEFIKPTCVLDMQDAQQLIDELWQCGLRPSQAQASAGALSATQKHLDDMRALVFKKTDLIK